MAAYGVLRCIFAKKHLPEKVMDCVNVESSLLVMPLKYHAMSMAPVVQIKMTLFCCCKSSYKDVVLFSHNNKKITDIFAF